MDLGAKIKKKVYRFELKKRYQSVAHYKVKERPPIEKIKDAIKKLTTPKKPEKKEEAPLSSTPPKGGFNFVVFGAFILIALIILALGLLYFSSQFLPSGALQAPVDKPEINNTILGGQILTTGERGNPEYIAATMVEYNTSNLNNYSVVVSTYDEKLPSEVFVLTSERFEATSYSDFIRTLRADLDKRKIILNEISINQLETMPEGALVIVPSGVIPKEFLGFDSQFTPNTLADRGIVVLYIGQPFNKMYNGTLVVTTPVNVSNALPIKFDQSTSLTSADGFHLFQPLYRATSGGGWEAGIVYGSVSFATRGNGAFVFVPQTLDGGWRGNYTAAAEDIARIVFESPWATPNAPPAQYNFTNQTGYSGSRYFFSEPFKSPNATAKLEFIGYSNTSNFPVRETLVIPLEKKDQNNLYIDLGGRVVPTNITSLPVRMNAELNEPAPGQPSMLLAITDVNGTELQTFPQGTVDVQSDKSFDIQVFVERGEYIVKLVDDESRIYAQTYMKVVSPEIIYVGNENNRHSAYLFDIRMENDPFQLAQVDAKVDGGQYGTYTFNNVQRIRLDLGQYTGGEFLPQGHHFFEFTSGGLHLTVPVDHIRAKTIFDEPFFWIIMILTGGIVGVGMFFARQEEVYFALDIPDFPPVARTRIPLAPDVVLSIFGKVNETYRWQNTPLTTTEIKNGFKDIFVKGKPIYISDYNVEYLLEELEKRGKVKESLGYYGLSDWEEKAKRSIEYLSLMRRIRDICVNNAIPFTAIGESKEADTVITVVGQQISVHFYEKNANIRELLSRILPTIGKGISIVLFKGQADKEAFQQIINSSPSIAPLILKMEADSSSLLFLTGEELEKMLLEFKSM
ncbi:MAG TPA: hypothetical protein VLD37_05945 [Candidatus Bilamarchaeum sp.]|nr:hypothetical protein [Candidatus Bilamarchaeum sp.]